MENSATIMVKHLPTSLSSQHIRELLLAFGAAEIKTACTGRNKKPIAFATFNCREAADATIRRLHQLEVAGSRLCVEYISASNATNLNAAQPIEDESIEETGVATGNRPAKRAKLTESRPTLTNLNAISRSLGLDYPLNPKYRYRYPPPNYHALTNIMNCLVAVPQFYNQVLHLMNKMNLPSPFETVAMDMTLSVNLASHNDRMTYEANKSSSEESELESDEESSSVSLAAPASEKVGSKLSRKTKRLLARRSFPKQPAATSETPQANKPTSDVFDVSDPLVAKRIEFNLTAAKPAADPVPSSLHVEKSETVIPLMTSVPTTAVETEISRIAPTGSQFITDDQLKRSRITREGMTLLPVYKNYQPGKPTPRLYLKNLAKQVEEEDLKYIYGRYMKQAADGDTGALDIRLMKDGRMKGQAFITFPEEAWAVEALEATNGYVLHGKPMVVQFARSTKPKEM